MAASLKLSRPSTGPALLVLLIVATVVFEISARPFPFKRPQEAGLLFELQSRNRRLADAVNGKLEVEKPPDALNLSKPLNISCWQSTHVCCKQACHPCRSHWGNSTEWKICRHRNRKSEGMECRKQCEEVIKNRSSVSLSPSTVDPHNLVQYCLQPLTDTCQENGKERTERFSQLCKQMQAKCGSLESQNQTQAGNKSPLNVSEAETAVLREQRMRFARQTPSLSTHLPLTAEKDVSAANVSSTQVPSTPSSVPMSSPDVPSPFVRSSPIPFIIVSSTPSLPVSSTQVPSTPSSVPMSSSDVPSSPIPYIVPSAPTVPVSSTQVPSMPSAARAAAHVPYTKAYSVPVTVSPAETPKVHAFNTSKDYVVANNESSLQDIAFEAEGPKSTTPTSSENSSETLVTVSVLLALIVVTSGFVTTTAVKKHRRRMGKLNITPKVHHTFPTNRRVHWHAIAQEDTNLMRKHSSTDTVARWLLESSLDEYPRSHSRLSEQTSSDEYSPGTTVTSITASTLSVSSSSNGASSGPGSLLYVQKHLACQPADGVNLTDLLESPCHHMFINVDGGLIESGELGIRLDIPQNALAKDESCYVRVSVITYPTAFPVLQDGKSLLSPVVRLEPRGIAFKQAAQLQLPLSSCIHQEDNSCVRILYNQALPEHEPNWQPLEYDFDSLFTEQSAGGQMMNDRFCKMAILFTADFVITREQHFAPYTAVQPSIMTVANAVDPSPERNPSEENHCTSSQRQPQDLRTNRNDDDQPGKEGDDRQGHGGFPSREPEAPLVDARMKKRVAISVFGPAADDHSPNQPRLLRVYCHEDLPDIATRLQKAEVRGRDCFVLLSGPQPMHLEEKENVDVEICDVLADWLVVGPTKQTIPGGLCWDNFACPPHITFPVVRRYEAANDFFFCAFVIRIGTVETRLYVSQQCSIPQSLLEISHEPASMDDLPMRKIWSQDLAHSLGVALNTPPCGVGPDWRLLADRLGYTYLEIRRLEQTPMPTETLLWNWLMRPGSNVGTFRQALRDIRADALLQVMDDTVVGLTSGYLSLPAYAMQSSGARKASNASGPLAHSVHKLPEITSGEQVPSIVSSTSGVLQCTLFATADAGRCPPQTSVQRRPSSRLQNTSQGSHLHPSSLHSVHVAQESESSTPSVTPASTPSSTARSTATHSSATPLSVKAEHHLSLSPKSHARAAAVSGAVRRQASRDSLLSESTAGSDSGVSGLMSSAPTSRRGSGTATTELGLSFPSSPESPLAASDFAGCLKLRLAQSTGQEQQAYQSEVPPSLESSPQALATTIRIKPKRSGSHRHHNVAETSV